MQRYLVVAVIVLLCMHSLMPRVKGCNPSLRPGKNPRYTCVADDCGKRGVCGTPCKCIGNNNPWCNGYCTTG
uniref:Putative secreted protein n=1 Tax=Amblyomma americanum TaxID=6943 RepID=A0A0C9RVJ4_AMBAM